MHINATAENLSTAAMSVTSAAMAGFVDAFYEWNSRKQPNGAYRRDGRL